MGKFNGYLLCTDLDGTLLSDDKRVSEKNKKAVEYFKKEGGLFTFATGRVRNGLENVLKQITPNSPVICFNGGCIHDVNNNKELWSTNLSDNAEDAVRYICSKYPYVGMVVCTGERSYICKKNKYSDSHRKIENIPPEQVEYEDVPKPWKKVIFMMDADKVDVVRQDLLNTEFAEDFTFLQSEAHYFEILPKGMTKGRALTRLGDILGIDNEKTVGIGDNENDIELVKNAAFGASVANAVEEVKECAEFIAPDNNSDAIAALIEQLEKKIDE